MYVYYDYLNPTKTSSTRRTRCDNIGKHKSELDITFKGGKALRSLLLLGVSRFLLFICTERASILYAPTTYLRVRDFAVVNITPLLIYMFLYLLISYVTFIWNLLNVQFTSIHLIFLILAFLFPPHISTSSRWSSFMCILSFLLLLFNLRLRLSPFFLLSRRTNT